MNQLETVILDQHARVKAAGTEPLEALNEAQAEIMAVATPELTLSIINDHTRTHPEREARSTRAQIRAFQDLSSIGNRSADAIRNAHGLARLDMINPDNGYTGGLIFDRDEVILFGNSMKYNQFNQDDPIQAANGDNFYPPMMWAKALRAEAYKNRPESAKELSVVEYLSELGLTLGAMVSKYGDIIGATGFMPGPRLQTLGERPEFEEHVQAEPIEAFRLSGLSDQAILDPNLLLDTPWFAASILHSGGSLN